MGGVCFRGGGNCLIHFPFTNLDLMFPFLSDSIPFHFLPLLGIKKEKNGFHSFRHTFIDTLKQEGVEPHFINELVGHTQGDISSDRYGKNYNPDILYNKCIKRVVYQTSHTRNIDFLSLKLDWKKIVG